MRLDVLLSFTNFIVGITLLLVVLNRNKHAISILLALFIFTNAYSNLVNFLIQTKQILNVPAFFGTGILAILLRPLTLYFYLRFLLNERKRIKYKDALHLLPAALCLVNYGPLFVSSNVQKRQLLDALYQNDLSFYLNTELFRIPPFTILLAANFLNLFYIFLIIRLILKQNKTDRFVLLKGTQVLIWLNILVSTFALSSLLGIIANLYAHYSVIWTVNIWQSLVFCGIICIALLFLPKVLYGSLYSIPEYQQPVVSHRNINITEDTNLLIKEKLKAFFEQRGYLQKNCRLADLAKSIDVQPYILSAFINQEYKMRFNDLINYYRIVYVSEGLLNSEWDQLTLEAIGEKAGFTNRTTFLNAFKKFRGTTPTAYLQQHKRNLKA